MAKKQFPLRLDQALYEILEHWAGDELRSVNAHIEFLLRDAAKRAGRFVDKDAHPSKGSTKDAQPDGE